MTEQPTTKISTELLAELGEWSEPVRVKVVRDVDDVLELVFKREEVIEHRPNRS